VEVELKDIFNAKMSDSDFHRLSHFIFTEYGIKMPVAKKIMLQSRLQKRLRELNIGSYHEYVDYVFKDKGNSNEIVHMIDVVSTNKTDFFRESSHFDFLLQEGLPEIYDRRKNRLVKIWSAGCSSGEEPYTMAMVLNEFGLTHSNFDFQVYATDISTRMLQKAVTAIYTADKVDPVPMTFKKRYLLKSKDPAVKNIRVIPELRRKVTFGRLNFMDTVYDIHETFDIIFCRNVLIYFDRETQEKVINKLCTKLKPDGFFFLGHSESIMNFNVPLKQIKPTIFLRV